MYQAARKAGLSLEKTEASITIKDGILVTQWGQGGVRVELHCCEPA